MSATSPWHPRFGAGFVVDRACFLAAGLGRAAPRNDRSVLVADVASRSSSELQTASSALPGTSQSMELSSLT